MRPLITLIALSIPALAAAEETTRPTAARPRPSIAASGVIALPQADADDAVDPSAGVGASIAYWAHPNVAVVGSFDYVFGNPKEDDVDIHFYSFNVGARFAPAERRGARPFGEVAIGRHTVGFAANGIEDSESDLGFRIGGGVAYRIAPGVAVVGRLVYSTAEIDDVDIDAFLIDVGIAWEP